MAAQADSVYRAGGTQRSTFWLSLLDRLLRPWIKFKSEPADPRTLLKPGVPVCYVLDRYGLSNTLILEDACREAGLPPPLKPIPGVPLASGRAMLALSRREGMLFRRPRTRTHSAGLAELLAAVSNRPDLDVQLVPVTIFVGRAPSRASGWFRVLFSENWIVVGRFRRLLSILLNGRDTIVHFSASVSLRQVVAEGLDHPRTVRKVSRALRSHFRRLRAAIIGPDLSHRRTIVDAVINGEGVRTAIAQLANKESIPLEKAQARAREYAWEIAADYSHAVVRSLSLMLNRVWNQIYEGVDTHHFDQIKTIAPGHEVIYVPCHRSHMDYLLLSYLLHTKGIVPPHIAAGVNLNLPVLGPILRRGGAFFLRRSFRANALYSAVFSEYVSQLFARGVSMEYFIEGGRSRTGRLLAPRAGMLAMTVRSFLAQSRRPVVFQPVYIGYERLIEGRSYISELSGEAKQKESLFGLLRSFGILRQKYGKVAVSFGEPIYLEAHLDSGSPGWRGSIGSSDRPEWFGRAVDSLAENILIQINRSADVNPINLIALAILSMPKHAMGEGDLLAQLALSRGLLLELPYSDRVSVTPLAPSEVIAYAEKMGVIRRVKHPLGDVLACDADQALQLSYFRNNVAHLYATASWVACCFLNNRRLRRGTVVRLGKFIYPFLRNELFLPWTDEEFGERIEKTIDLFVERGMLKLGASGSMLRRRVGQTDAAFRLRVVAQNLTQAFERYYIAVAVLVRNGPGTLSTGELENLCHLIAQRLSLLYERTAPEYFDKNLFRGFIATLKELKVVWLDSNAKLDFGDALAGIAKDARIILAREVRHSILKLTASERPGAPPPAPAAPAPAAD